MAQNHKNIEIQLRDIDVLTAGVAAEIANGILEFLLFHRSQIPFVYKTYKYYVEKWDETDETQKTEASFGHYQLQKQRSLAKDTKEAISNMRELIRCAFRSNKAVKSLRFLFGSNTFMPTESYTIHIPHTSISKYHGDIHGVPEGQMNRTLLHLLTCEELYALWSKDLKATNVFLELELLTPVNSGEHCESWKLFPKDVISQLPRSCKNVHLHLLHAKQNEEVQCVKEMTIYEDMSFLNLDQPKPSKKECIEDTEHSSGWWQTDIIVRGFRPPTFNLWST
ncbi:uncharacterized protein LOC6567481 [Drosophila grimshawi]|uniref:GH21185 n=1 Tax=Drosophila grimshawi TaxID=7222 RepID=B4JRP8_DROGR|nr:uncharacterized protein LOC6567481 [Drosophila grimshawi]EDV94438.1 GH21185 [Drosophila grimshawi]